MDVIPYKGLTEQFFEYQMIWQTLAKEREQAELVFLRAAMAEKAILEKIRDIVFDYRMTAILVAEGWSSDDITETLSRFGAADRVGGGEEKKLNRLSRRRPKKYKKAIGHKPNVFSITGIEIKKC